MKDGDDPDGGARSEPRAGGPVGGRLGRAVGTALGLAVRRPAKAAEEAVRGTAREVRREVTRPWREGREGKAAEAGRWIGVVLAAGATLAGVAAAWWATRSR